MLRREFHFRLLRRFFLSWHRDSQVELENVQDIDFYSVQKRHRICLSICLGKFSLLKVFFSPPGFCTSVYELLEAPGSVTVWRRRSTRRRRIEGGKVNENWKERRKETFSAIRYRIKQKLVNDFPLRNSILVEKQIKQEAVKGKRRLTWRKSIPW